MKTKLSVYLFLGFLLIFFSFCDKDDDGDGDLCGDTNNIYTFTYDGKAYELIRENKTWEEAVDCASERGGYLAEINSKEENDALFNEIISNGSIDNSKTIATDGGGASYVWIGGNDFTSEGSWVWDGNRDGTTIQFWQGTTSGSAVDGLYNNWGYEPDNYGNGQDALGLALTEWPLNSGRLGVAGQWNDVKHTNTLYYLVEYN